MLLLIRNKEHVLWGAHPCVVGYTVIHSLDAIMAPKLLIEGSWSATISIPLCASFVLLMRLCWQMRDLFMFCCQMLKVPVRVVFVVSDISPSLLAVGSHHKWHGLSRRLLRIRWGGPFWHLGRLLCLVFARG
jgi:hypothetical protein